MAVATYDDARLIVKLYDLRREEKLRTARAWIQQEYSAATVEEFLKKFPPGSETNAYFRMVLGYWEMAASFVAKGILHEELFFENNGEMLSFWERAKPVIVGFREAYRNPQIGRNLEETARRHKTWLEEKAPGAWEAMRARIAGA